MDDFIAIDGGGSGSRAVRRRPGTPARQAQAGPANAFSDPDGAADAIMALIQSLTDGAPVPRVVAGIAGCRLPAIADRLTRALPVPALIVDDSVTAAHGALGPRDGVLINLGTGSFFLRKMGAEMRHIGGWGLALGDVASGAWFGRAALSAALRAADGQAPRDALTDHLMSPHPLMRPHTPAAFASLAPLVFAHADTPTAQSLITAAIAEIQSAIQALEAPEAEPIVLVGGLAPALCPHLPEPLQARLSEPLGTALDGAVRLAEITQ